MSKDEYGVTTVSLKELDFEAVVLTLPEKDLDDKLTYLSREKGKVTKNLFEDWLIANCVANINQLLFSVNHQLDDGLDLMKMRKELVAAIISNNEALAPDNLVINSNHVIKIKKGKNLKKGEKKLTNSKYWDKVYYPGEDATGGNFTSPPTVDKPVPKKPKKSLEELKDIKDLEFAEEQKWWKRIGRYVNIKKFNEEDVESILRKNFFHNRTSFQTFIVSVCVSDFEELFSLLDNMGIPNRVAPPILMHELYELCKSVDPFLTFENAQELSSEEIEDEDAPNAKGGKRTAGSMSQYVSKASKSKKRFKDISKADLLKLGDSMKVFLIGQDQAIDDLTNSIQRASVGLKDPNKPIGSFLFAGRTGVGKTLATKVLADELIRGRDNMITIDCSEYSADHEYSKLIGAPAGYVGHENGGMLTNAVSKNPFTVVVFDEVEKASHKVHELLLQILEEGRLTDGKGKMVSFKDTVIVMTSNVGVKEVESIKHTVGFGNASDITEEKKDSALTKALKKKFKPEFLNRIDSIINFNSLQKQDYMRIIDIELYKLNQNLRTNDTDFKNLTLEFDKNIKDLIYKTGIDEEYGARPLKREIEKLISTPLAKELLSDKFNVDGGVNISADGETARFVVSTEIENPPFYITDKFQAGAVDIKSVGECND